jgi:hypothetical protein
VYITYVKKAKGNVEAEENNENEKWVCPSLLGPEGNEVVQNRIQFYARVKTVLKLPITSKAGTSWEYEQLSASQ